MKILSVPFLFFTSYVFAGSIGFGEVDAVKIYDFDNDKSVRVYLKPGATMVKQECLENDKVLGILTMSQHEAEFADRTISLALAAYMSGKNVRLYSQNDSCQIDFISIQDQYY